ncbi:MAG: hypothetical protein AB7E49_08675 [Campylobacterales bacterium]
MSKEALGVLALGVAALVLFAYFWPQDELPAGPAFVPVERKEALRDKPLAPQTVVAKTQADQVNEPVPPTPPIIPSREEQPQQSEYVLASVQDSRAYHRIEIVSPYAIAGPRSPERKAGGIQMIAIEGDLGDGYTFRLTLPAYLHEYATDLQLRLSNLFDPQSQSVYADFLYGAAMPGRYRLELRREPLEVIGFEQTAQFTPLPAFEIPQDKTPFSLGK